MKYMKNLAGTTVLMLSLSMLCLAENHPDPQGAKENLVLDLKGAWTLHVDANEQGLAQESFEKDFLQEISLPGTTDEWGIGDFGPETPDRIGVLTRRHEYLGVIWLTREVDIPEDWKGKEVELFLERVIWESRVWLDGKEVGKAEDSLSSPHLHQLGLLSPGKHRLHVRIDNRMIHPIGNKSHAYTEQCQSRWNGVVGRVELRAEEPEHIDALRIFTEGRQAEFEVHLNVPVPGLKLKASILDSKSGLLLASMETSTSGQLVRMKLNPGEKVQLWSEFSPKTYMARVELLQGTKRVDFKESSFGFRSISHNGNQLLLNGQPVFMRGNLDGVHFVKTGYPSTKKEDWLEIFQIYKDHHLNQIRFHSWCPPEAAFEAADELGIYIQAEAPIWIDFWMTEFNIRPEMNTEGYPQGLGQGDRSTDGFARAEFRRILDTYGNHPSFVFFCFGNELKPSKWSVLEKWVGELKEYDSRRLYAASTARNITKNCEYNASHRVPGIGLVRQRLQFGTNWDYEEKYSRTKIPIIAHEPGQWPVYPEWSIINKFDDSVFRNTHMERLREEAKANGVYGDQEAFTRSSGAMNRLLYKDEIESFLRTPSCRGFQLLGMQDYQGQGEAYIGWLDCFYESKGTTDLESFRGYCAPVVALAKLPKYVYVDGETLSCDLFVRNDGPVDLKGVRLDALLNDADGKAIARQTFQLSAKRGEVLKVGQFKTAVRADKAVAVELVLKLEGKEEDNRYPLWLFPTSLPSVDTSDILITKKFDKAAQKALAQGRSVLLKANQAGSARTKRNGGWKPLYWSTPFFPGQLIDTLGLVVRDEHAVFDYFPTSYFNDWQWYRICDGARGFDITGEVPPSYKPLAQPVTDFHLNRKIGSLFELKAGKGKLLVCGYNLDRDLPEVKQLKYSLLKYMKSGAFNPTQGYDMEKLKHLFQYSRPATASKPPEAEKAIFHVKSGAEVKSGEANWAKKLDNVLVEKAVRYTLKKGAIMRKGPRVGWFGARITVELKIPVGFQGDFYAHFRDNGKSTRGRVTFEDHEVNLGAHGGKGIWLKFNVSAEDSRDGTLILDVENTSSMWHRLMITEIALLPK